MRLRRQIFRQVVQIERRRADARQAKFVQDDGKDASKRAAKALAGNCAVLPIIIFKKMTGKAASAAASALHCFFQRKNPRSVVSLDHNEIKVNTASSDRGNNKHNARAKPT